jgi:serine/threonine-protein kinase
MIVESHPETGFDLHVLDLHTRKLRPWLRTQASETDARWSPDGKWVAYMTGETGHWEVHVRSYPNGGGRWQIAPDYGEFPSWSADGRTIYVLKRPRLGTGWKLFAVPVEPRGGELSPGVATQVYAQPTMLFAAAGPGGMMLMTGEPPQQQATEVRVMLEWPSMVR